MCATLYFASRDCPEVKGGSGGRVLLRISRFAVFSLCCIRSLPNLRAPRTKTRRPHVNTQNQTSEPCSEGIRSMCLTQINCLPASLCLDTAWSFAVLEAGGKLAARINLLSAACPHVRGHVGFCGTRLKKSSCYSPSLLFEEFQRACQKKSMVPP